MNYQYKAAAAITAHALKWNGARNEFDCRLFSFGDEQASGRQLHHDESDKWPEEDRWWWQKDSERWTDLKPLWMRSWQIKVLHSMAVPFSSCCWMSGHTRIGLAFTEREITLCFSVNPSLGFIIVKGNMQSVCLLKRILGLVKLNCRNIVQIIHSNGHHP